MDEQATATDITATTMAGEADTEQHAQEATTAGQSEMTIDDYKVALANVRAEAAASRVELKELRPIANKYKEIQDAEKTELQRAQEALEAERTRATQLDVELKLAQALAKYGITEDNADLLGTDPEKFEANAKRLGELQAEAARKAAPPTDYPVEDLKPGASGREPVKDFTYPSNWPVKGQFTKNGGN